jgi:hypothetical protein
MVGPYVEFNSPSQKVLQIHIQQHGKEGMLEIMDTTRLIERKCQPGAIHQEFNGWEKVLQFFEFENEKGREPGHIVYLLPEWNYYGRVGTLKHFLWEVWGEWPWGLIGIFVGSVLGGLTLLYAIYRFAVLVYNSSPSNGVQGTNQMTTRRTSGMKGKDCSMKRRTRLLSRE